MSKLSKYVVILAISTGLGAAAVAADSGDRASGDQARMGAHKMTPEKMRERMAAHQAAVHDKLKLTAAQEPAWKAFIADTTPTDLGKHQEDRTQMQAMSAPERLERHLAMRRERDARMSERLVAVKKFYAVLTPEQQQIFNQETMRHGKRHGDGALHQKG